MRIYEQIQAYNYFTAKIKELASLFQYFRRGVYLLKTKISFIHSTFTLIFIHFLAAAHLGKPLSTCLDHNWPNILNVHIFIAQY